MADALDKLYKEPPGSKETEDSEGPDAQIVVPVGDDEETETDDEDGGPPAAAEGEKPTRKQKRAERGRNRVKEANERAEAAERAAEEARLSAARAEARAEAYRDQMASFRQPQGGDPDAEYRRKRSDILGRQRRIQEQFEALGEAEQAAQREQMQNEIYDLDDQLDDLRASRRRGPDQGRMASQVQEAIVRARHQDVLGTPAGEARTRSHFIRMVGVEGKPKTLATFEEAVQMAREEQGGQRHNPAEKSRLRGLSARGNGSASGKRPTEIRMGPHERSMAREAYSHLPEEEAFKRWANDMAKRMERE